MTYSGTPEDPSQYVIHKHSDGKIEYTLAVSITTAEVLAEISAEYPDDQVFIIDRDDMLDDFFIEAWECDAYNNLSYNVTKLKELVQNYTRAHSMQMLDRLRLSELLGENPTNTIASDFSTFQTNLTAATDYAGIVSLLNSYHVTLGYNWRQGATLADIPLDDQGNF